MIQLQQNGYQHHQTEYWINDSTGSAVRKGSEGEDPSCADSQSKLLADIKYVLQGGIAGSTSLAAHFVAWKYAHGDYIIPKLGDC
jgi:hypothetical protein